ncbi:MAG: hypothetical protein EOO89_26640 [Pedobacter sp.]|nr:MAG: hypothetical protein EOO89_26640 [Pedobacter sp.]
MSQNLKNHRRFYPLFHFIFVPVTVFFIFHSILGLIHEPNYLNSALTGAFILIFLAGFCARISAIKAQDRAIKVEVGLRYFILSGKALPATLRLGQIVALRFAPDEELVALTEKAGKEQLSSSDIKHQIQNWKPDTHRV